MYITLKDKNLNNEFIKFFIEFTNIDNIQDWIFLNDTTETSVNSEFSINYSYVLINPEYDKVAIYWAGFGKSLEIKKKFEIFPLSFILENKFNFSEVLHLNLNEKLKKFQLFCLNKKLSEKLSEKNLSFKKNKL